MTSPFLNRLCHLITTTEPLDQEQLPHVRPAFEDTLAVAYAGWAEPVSRKVAEAYLSPLIRRRIDTLILGCTHYPMLAETIRRVLGRDVTLIDSAKQTASEVRGVLTGTDALCLRQPTPRYRFFVTDGPHQFNRVGQHFLGQVIRSVEQVSAR